MTAAELVVSRLYPYGKKKHVTVRNVGIKA